MWCGVYVCPCTHIRCAKFSLPRFQQIISWNRLINVAIFGTKPSVGSVTTTIDGVGGADHDNNL